MPFPFRKVHMIGVGGAGMSAIALALLSEGVTVTGSDLEISTYTERVSQAGGKVFIGHKEGNVGEAEAVIVSSAIPHDNLELLEAKRRKLPILHRADALALLMESKQSVAVAGTHGKSTTAAMIGHILTQLGYDPTVLVGAEVINFGSNCRMGSSDWFVTEADESDGSFLKLSPNHIVITNIELDHPDHYANDFEIFQAFVQFAERLKGDGLLVVNADCPRASKLPFQLSLPVWWMSFGLKNEADYEAKGIRRLPDGSWVFQVQRRPKLMGEVRLRVPGEHNVSNAMAALVLCHEILGLPFSFLSEAISTFKGVKRRFEILGRVGGVTIVDDYAHHPTELKALLKTARSIFSGRIWVIFQPHRFSRTEKLWKEFGNAFKDADGVWVTEIFAASEEPIEGVSGSLIYKAISQCEPEKLVRFESNWEKIVSEIQSVVAAEDALLIVGAGDIYKIAAKLLTALSKGEGGGDEGVGR
ncbi:MAG: UDP-N-acetylmuramate--L-alanine ligase [Armatimonadetes bacterium]|nr:UDP-N-acetylmuramate--L-alanine ligase [Armatimonadota bacterium]MDW8026919.1 UDP-N-acetylmuramate--L-alanine ligase [Armatimonadota bacterium]